MKKIAYLGIVLLSMGLFVLSCGKDDGPDGPDAKSPEIESVSPLSGPVGTLVTLDGKNFGAAQADNTVKFNGVTASIATASTTRLTVEVPDGAQTGKITVKVGNGTATSGSDFVVTPSAIQLSQTELEYYRGDTENLSSLIENLSDFEGSTMQWKSDDTDVASVTNNGDVTAIDLGTTTLTVTIGSLSETVSVVVNPDFYAGGFIRNGDNDVATVWKNGQVHYSLNQESQVDASVYSLKMDGSDIIASGYAYSEENNAEPKLWKNGSLENLGHNEVEDGLGNSVFINSEDIYVVGYIREDFKYEAIRWTNGVSYSLPVGDYYHSGASAIFINETGEYIAGTGSNGVSFAGDAILWKNEEIILLSSGNQLAESFDLDVSANGKYVVVGYEENDQGIEVAKLWENDGESISLGNGLDNSQARSVERSNNDIYVGGYQDADEVRNGKIWKNDSDWVTLNSVGHVDIWSIFVFGDYVYATGAEFADYDSPYQAKVWKINMQGQIVETIELDREIGEESYAFSIFVK